ncbi:MAG: efflux RND transporter periplasmic adaptor subunit, partial [Peptococcaceae bacterium]|nr:efflux RND transporter periplasmic adaptor subunit [Peptococcaceae bacterium]
SDKLTITLSIDQDDITNVELDQQALVTFDTNKKTYEGYVNAISVSPAMMGSPTVNYTVTVLVEGEGMEDIYEGMSCTVDLVADRVDDVLIVPKRAITSEDGKNYVTVKQEDGSSVKQEVTLGFTDGSNYEVKEGLNEGDIILISSAIGSTGSGSGGMSASGSMGNMPSGMPSGSMPSDDMPSFEGGIPSGAPGNS